MFKNPVLRFLSSLRLAIFLLLILAATSIVGTVLPQGEPVAFYLQKYGPFWGKIIKFFQLYDAYHSWWYVALLALFCLNLIFCSWKRFPFSWQLYKRNPLEVDPEKLKRMPVSAEVFLPGNKNDLKERVYQLVSQKWGKITEHHLDQGIVFLKDKFRWSYFSVYAVHLAILIIVMGGIIGALWGFRGSIMLLEGESTNQVVIQGRHQHLVSLPFKIRCDKFFINFYANGMPKEFRSDVTVIDGKKELKKTIRVNHPLTYKGITFYQATYQSVAEAEVKLILGQKEKTLVVKPFGQVAYWPEENIRLGLMDFGEAHGLMAARFWISVDDGAPQSIWVLTNHPRRLETKKGELTIVLEDLRPIYATGLQVKRDPGLFLVLTGFVVLIMGIFAAFFFGHQRYWVALVPEQQRVRVIIAGMSPKHREKVRKEVEELKKALEELKE